tara:strand:- start:31 stop:474 length:444 start_codon:yes stop_codon:yes gene_type:complete
MKELGMALGACGFIAGFFITVIYPDVEHKNHPRLNQCIDECYLEDIRLNGTVTEQLRAKKLAAQGDPFASIRSLWSGCAACHGANGGGGIGPKLAGQTSDYISSRLITYKNNGTVGAQSALMWGQAAMLSDTQIESISNFIQEGFPQ